LAEGESPGEQHSQFSPEHGGHDAVHEEVEGRAQGKKHLGGHTQNQDPEWKT